MNFEQPCNQQVHILPPPHEDEDGDTTADFYFDDPALLFPLSPTSVRKEIVSLTPKPFRTRMKFGKLRKTLHGHHYHQSSLVKPNSNSKCPAHSPGSAGTQSTTDWMEEDDDDDTDQVSCCGSLAYSVETDRFLEELEDDHDEHNMITAVTGMIYQEGHDDVIQDRQQSDNNLHSCFQLLDGVLTQIQKVFQKPSASFQQVVGYEQDVVSQNI